MTFKLTIKDKVEERELDGSLSSETMVSKKNGEIVVEDVNIEDGDEIELIQIIYGG